ncbi:HCP-like protein, partial [Rhizoclosmatium globosum]
GQSVAWFMKAWASSQHKDAAMALGDAFTKGIGVPADPQKAVLWYSRAWDAGLPEAMYNLGRCYRDGRGCMQNEGTALMWFQRA